MTHIKKLKYKSIELYGCWAYRDKLKNITVGKAMDDYWKAGRELAK